MISGIGAPRGWTAADIFNFIGVFPIAKARMTVRRRKVDGSLAYAGLSCSRFLFLLKSRQALRIYQNRKENDNHEAPKEMAASRLHKKLRRGHNRQVLKEELRTVMLGEEDFDVYGDNGISAAGTGRNLRIAA